MWTWPSFNFAFVEKNNMARECFKKHCVFYSNCLIAVNFTNFLYTVFLVWRWPLLVLGQVLLKRPLLSGWKNSLRVRTLSFIGTSFMPMLIRWDLGYSIWELNPSYSNISICVLDTVIYTFPTSETWRICLTIKSLLRWKPFTVCSHDFDILLGEMRCWSQFVVIVIPILS